MHHLRETYHDKQHRILIEKQQKLFIDSLSKKMNIFHENFDQGSKQEEEELQQSIETYHNKQHKTMIDSSSNKLKLSRETADKLFKIQEEILNQMREYLK